jgi:hypothetical protein
MIKKLKKAYEILFYKKTNSPPNAGILKTKLKFKEEGI